MMNIIVKLDDGSEYFYKVKPTTYVGPIENENKTDKLLQKLKSAQLEMEEPESTTTNKRKRDSNEDDNKREIRVYRLALDVCRDVSWDQDFAECAVREYFKFLELKCVMNDTEGTDLSPSPLIDEVWHQHILDTRMYKQDVLDIFAELKPQTRKEDAFIDHFPARAHDDKAVKEKRLDKTKTTYLARFNQIPDPKYWDLNAAAVLFKNTCRPNLISSLSERLGVDPGSMRLCCEGQHMEYDRTFGHYGVEDWDILYLFIPQVGC